MDNAAKALIIAGAILISILLIAISMYVYNSAQSTVTAAGQNMTANEKQMYNKGISQYEGTSKTGIDIRSLLDAIISSNHTNMTDTGKFIAVEVKNIDAARKMSNDTVLKNSANKCTNLTDSTVKVGEAGYADNSSSYVNGTAAAMTRIKSYINTAKRYDVTTTVSDTGLINYVLIEQK